MRQLILALGMTGAIFLVHPPVHPKTQKPKGRTVAAGWCNSFDKIRVTLSLKQ